MQLQGRRYKGKKLVEDGPPVDCILARVPFLFGSGMVMVTALVGDLYYVHEHKTGLKIAESKAATRAESIALAEAYLKQKTLPVVVARYKEVSKML